MTGLSRHLSRVLAGLVCSLFLSLVAFAQQLRWVNHKGARTPKETETFIQTGRDSWASVIKTIGLVQR